ncbi:hypothetical protein EXIGUO9Y_110129 [Exiguobacterium oxidotolerans]|uniref:Uncharacterized protein n=1 Tax=Exiguobacterium oxidotolerans TaxID=223958 RepID=A0A653I315_9BACL|nr:hypothetical protein EXIGUO9Y_110129 [Exiguobacterium oxidotolerans]
MPGFPSRYSYKKRHISLTPTGKSAFLTHFSEAGKTLLVVREDQGATACASPEESNEKRRLISR